MRICWLILMILTSFFNQTHLVANVMRNNYSSPEYVVISEKILSDIAITLSKRHKMSFFGDVGGMARCVNLLGLVFQIPGPLSKNQLREILIDCVEELLNAINTNEKLRPYLKNYPFTAKEVEIKLFIIDQKGEDIYDPEIDVAAAHNGILRFTTTDKNNTFVYKSQIKEDYETALKIVKEKKQSNLDKE